MPTRSVAGEHQCYSCPGPSVFSAPGSQLEVSRLLSLHIRSSLCLLDGQTEADPAIPFLFNVLFQNPV